MKEEGGGKDRRGGGGEVQLGGLVRSDLKYSIAEVSLVIIKVLGKIPAV